MSLVQINNLTFKYESDYENVFENVNLNIDTNWKLGLIGRNGKGKTTFLKLLTGKLKGTGSISKNVEVTYFPYLFLTYDDKQPLHKSAPRAVVLGDESND